MPTPRKERPSLIAPGSILPAGGGTPAGGPGLMEKIVQKDGVRHGRVAEAEPEAAETRQAQEALGPPSEALLSANHAGNAQKSAQPNALTAGVNGITSNTVSNITDNTVSQSYDNTDDNMTSRPAGQSDRRPADTSGGSQIRQTTDKATGRLANKAGGRLTDQERSQKDSQKDTQSAAPDVRGMIAHLAKSVTVAITLKAPFEMNQYLDDYVHERHREKIRKQDLIKRGLMLAIYELETGEELVRFDG